jgi:hypothetical protein
MRHHVRRAAHLAFSQSFYFGAALLFSFSAFFVATIEGTGVRLMQKVGFPMESRVATVCRICCSV